MPVRASCVLCGAAPWRDTDTCCAPAAAEHVQAMATACVFLATKIDSSYHRLDSVAHACFRALRAHQQREPEPEYFNADGVSAAAAAAVLICQAMTTAMQLRW
jgi:hypothetical protein